MSEIETIKSWMQSIDQKLEKNLTNYNDKFLEMNSVVIKNTSDILNVEEDLKVVKSDIKEIKDDVKKINNNKPTLKERVIDDGISSFIKTIVGLLALAFFIAGLNVFGISILEFLKVLIGVLF